MAVPKIRNTPDQRPDPSETSPQTVQDDATPSHVMPSNAAPTGGQGDPLEAMKAFLAQQQGAPSPTPILPRPIDPSVFQTAQKNLALAAAANRVGIHTPNWYEVQRGKGPIDTDPEGSALMERAATMPLQAELQRHSMDLETSKILNDFAERQAQRENLLAAAGLRATAPIAMVPYKMAADVEKEKQLGPIRTAQAVETAKQEAPIRIAQAGGEAEARAPAQIKVQQAGVNARTVAGQNKPPPDATVNMGRLATNALDASGQARQMLDQDKTTWDKGLVAHIPGTSYQIGTDTAKKFQTLMGLAYSQLTQSDEVRRTVSNINEALGRTTVVPGDSYDVAKFKLDNFDKIMTRLQKTVAVNHPAWSLLPGNEAYGRYVTPEMKEAALKTPAQRLQESSAPVQRKIGKDGQSYINRGQGWEPEE